MNDPPNQLFPILRPHVVLPLMSKICRTFASSVRSVVFAMELRLFWKFLPMNTADSIVTAINIHQIIECSSLFPVTLEILFCLFRI